MSTSASVEEAVEECGTPSTPAGEKTPPTRHAPDGDITVDSAEPLNTSDDGRAASYNYRRVTDAPSHEQDSVQLEGPSFRDQPSHEDVRRLQEDNEQIRRSNEAKNMVFDAIYDQVSEKVKKMLKDSVGTEKAHSKLQFSKLSDQELNRLAIWLTENKPFADIKEYEIEPPEDSPLSVEEENDDGTDGVPVFPQGQVQSVQSAQHDTDRTASKCKKMVERTESVLGSGSYGEVRVARHNGQCYAAKELKMQDGHYMDYLYREAGNLALLDNENIVKFCGIGMYKGQYNGSFLILTELMATNLQRYIMEGEMSIPNGISILYNIVNGLECMHRYPAVIHGDLKTKNVLLSEAGIAKIADLGSSFLANDKVDHVVHGTATYMAPEMARRVFTEKIDVFAYGHLSLVTLTRWEMGLADFSKPCDNTPREIGKRQKLFDKLQQMKVVSDFIPLVQSCLCDEPKQRPSMYVLKAQMQELTLPRILPNVSVDTAVRNEV